MKKNFLKRRAALHTITALIAIFVNFSACESTSQVPAAILETANGTKRIEIELATTPQQRQQGLMFREQIPDDYGMLFVFQYLSMGPFWMKNTPSSLDIIFISSEQKVINIAEKTTPHSEERIYSESPYLYVLEIKAGNAEKWGLKPGASIKFELPGLN